MVAAILRIPCLTEDQWDQASLPVKLAGLGVNQTKVTAASAYVGSCTLTKNLVAAMLGVDAELSLVKFTRCRLSVMRNPSSRNFLPNAIPSCLMVTELGRLSLSLSFFLSLFL